MTTPKLASPPQLTRFVALSAVILFICLGLFGWQSWLQVKRDEILNMSTALELTERSTDRYFMEMGVALLRLGSQIVGATPDLAVTQRQLKEFQKQHPELTSISLVGLDGKFLAMSTTPKLTGLPDISLMRGYPAVATAFDTTAPMELTAPVFAPLAKRWVLPMRYALRNASGDPVGLIVAAAPVEMLQFLWSDAPIMAKVSISLLRDDGFLLSRYPLPNQADLSDVYGKPRDGAVRKHTIAHGFPSYGYIEGVNLVGQANYGTVFKRLEHFPVTLLVATPIATFRQAWLRQMRAPFGMAVLLILGAWLGLRLYARQAKQAADDRHRADLALEKSMLALAASEARALLELDTQSEVICRVSKDGTFLFANAAFCQTFAIGRDVVGSSWHMVPMPEDIPKITLGLASLSPVNPQVVIENRVLIAGGAIRWFQWVNKGSFDHDGKLIDMQCVGRDITERQAMESALRTLSDELTDLYDHSPCCHYSMAPDGTILRMNKTGLAWLGRSGEEVIGRMNGVDMFTPAGQALFQHAFSKLLVDGEMNNLEFELVSASGSIRQVNVSETLLKDAQDQILWSRSVMYDVSALRRAQEQAAFLHHDLTAMLDNELIAIVKVRDRVVVWQNRAMQTLFGYTSQEIVGQSSRMLHEDQENFERAGEESQPVVASGKPFRSTYRMLHKDGTPRWIDCYGAMLSAEKDEVMWIMADITTLKSSQLQLQHVASHDALTGLPNRALLLNRLAQSVAVSAQNDTQLAVCFLDLDGFKPVNDLHGHAAGDKVLKEVATRLLACVRGTDTVARIGGDEFMLLLTAFDGARGIDMIMQRILNSIALPFDINALDAACISVSIGVAVYPDEATQPEVLVRLADQAMYRAKQQGGNQACRLDTASGAHGTIRGRSPQVALLR